MRKAGKYMAADEAGVAERKAALRRQIVTARARMPLPEREAAGRAIRDHVLSLPEVAAAGTIAAYYSAGTEPATHSLVYALWKRGSYVILPLLLPDGDLDWASYEGPDSLVPGPRGLLQPGEPPRGIETVSRADVVLAPAVAEDGAGYRLARVGQLVPLIALLYDAELVARVPAAGHDQRVRAVACPANGITQLPLP